MDYLLVYKSQVRDNLVDYSFQSTKVLCYFEFFFQNMRWLFHSNWFKILFIKIFFRILNYLLLFHESNNVYPKMGSKLELPHGSIFAGLRYVSMGKFICALKNLIFHTPNVNYFFFKKIWSHQGSNLGPSVC